MKAEWIKSQTSEMDGLWRRGVFQKVFRSSRAPQDCVFTSCFHYTIKRTGGEFDKCKVRLVVQGQHMRQKSEDGVVMTTTLSVPYRLPADSAPLSIWLHNKTCSLITLMILRLLFRENYYLVTVTMEMCIFLHLLDMM